MTGFTPFTGSSSECQPIASAPDRYRLTSAPLNECPKWVSHAKRTAMRGSFQGRGVLGRPEYVYSISGSACQADSRGSSTCFPNILRLCCSHGVSANKALKYLSASTEEKKSGTSTADPSQASSSPLVGNNGLLGIVCFQKWTLRHPHRLVRVR